jgi:hypothetical protein
MFMSCFDVSGGVGDGASPVTVDQDVCSSVFVKAASSRVRTSDKNVDLSTDAEQIELAWKTSVVSASSEVNARFRG